MSRGLHCAVAVLEDGVHRDLRVLVDDDGRVAAIERGVPATAGDLRLGVVLPGFVNAHSHAFHRVLRGRTHADGGDFWGWRRRMYAVAAVLDPDLLRALAQAVFTEMLAAGWTSVGEFHYLHGAGAGAPHAMEEAVADAAEAAGIRLTLLDALYLESAPGRALEPAQRRFGDGSAERWLERWHALAQRLAGRGPLVTLGAAVHSLRAVPPAAVATAVAGLPAGTPLHAHVSEQPRENEQVLAAHGATPMRLLADAGALGPAFSAVHATHLTPEDVALLGADGATAVLCPTTEADLGDGLPAASSLADAGAHLAVGTDQHVSIDPFRELQALEGGQRLVSGRRGVLPPGRLLGVGTAGGARSLGQCTGLVPGGFADLVEVDAASTRTAGADLAQLLLTASAADVRRTVVGGRVVAAHPAPPLADAIARIDARIGA